MNKNNELNNKRKEIRYLFGWAKRINTKDAWDLYHLRRSDYYHWVQKAKREYKKKQFENVENDAEFWSKVNEYSDNVSKEETEIEIEHDGKRIRQPLEVSRSRQGGQWTRRVSSQGSCTQHHHNQQHVEFSSINNSPQSCSWSLQCQLQQCAGSAQMEAGTVLLTVG